MRILCSLLLSTALLASCGNPETAADADAATPASASCATGSPLPVTGLCSDGNRAFFLTTDTSIQIFAPKCVWRTAEVSVSGDEALVFRTQDCAGEGWDRTVYTWVSGYLKQRMASAPEDQAGFALQVFDVPAGQTAEQVALGTLAQAAEEQRSRCITAPLPKVKVAGHAFELKPNEELTAEMNAANPDELWDACGPNGMTLDSVQFWEGREGRALFHMTGQDTPPWDPASFTFYRKDDDGSWRKAD